MKKLLTLILILFAAPCFGESYLCIGERATGFKVDDGLRYANFKPETWIIKSHEAAAVLYPDELFVYKHGKDFPSFACCATCNSSQLQCPGYAEPLVYTDVFWMSKKTLRYTASILCQYVTDGGNDDIYVEFGKCSKL